MKQIVAALVLALPFAVQAVDNESCSVYAELAVSAAKASALQIPFSDLRRLVESRSEQATQELGIPRAKAWRESLMDSMTLGYYGLTGLPDSSVREHALHHCRYSRTQRRWL